METLQVIVKRNDAVVSFAIKLLQDLMIDAIENIVKLKRLTTLLKI